MGIRFKCHHCQAPLNIKTELANKRGVCPQCQGKFRIPSESQGHSLSLDQSASTLSNPTPIAESDLARSGAKKLERKQVSGVSLPSQATETDASSDTPNRDSHAGELLYFVRPPSGGEYGPANKMTIELWIAQRRITGETLICQIGSSQWKKAKEVFAAHFILG
jgi:hypothetical protein